MINIKETKQGNVAIIVGKEHRDVAMRIFMALGAEILAVGNAPVVQSAVRTLADIDNAVGGVKLTLNRAKVASPVVRSLIGLSAEKQGSEVIAILADKIPEYHHSKLRSFYTDIERDTGAKLYSEGKRIAKSLRRSEIGKYPNRKMDVAISLIGAEEVLEYARRYAV